MLRFEFVFPYEDMNLFLFGDDHEGNLNRHATGFDMMVDMINSPFDGLPPSHNRALDHGDFIEGIHVTDPRYQMDMTTIYEEEVNSDVEFNRSQIATKQMVKKMNIDKQVDAGVKNRMGIRDKMLMMLDGNHPWKLQKYGDLTARACKDLGINFGSYTAHITYKAKRLFGPGEPFYLFNHFAGHGWRSVNSRVDPPERAKVNMQIQLKNNLKDMAGDTLVMSMGHTHKLIYKPPVSQLYIQGEGAEVVQRYTGPRKLTGFIHPDYRWFINTGSFLKLYGPVSGYAERAGYSPNELGFAVLLIRGGKVAGVKRVVLGSTGVTIFND
jgi:hypothetical protein